MFRFRTLIGSGLAGLCSVAGVYKFSHDGPLKAKTTPAEQTKYQHPVQTGHRQPDLKLVQVQIFARHGARTPHRFFEGIEEEAYDKDVHGVAVPHAEVEYEVMDLETGGPKPYSKLDEVALKRIFKGGMTASKLTVTGKEQLYQLGQALRDRYITQLGLVSSQFNTKDVYVRSTNMDRTLESLQALIGGMFGVEHFKNNPLIVPVKNYLSEDLCPNVKNCKAMQQIGATLTEDLLKDAHYLQTMTTVQKIIGTDTFLDLVMLFDHVDTRKVHGVRLEQWMLDMEKDIEKAAVAAVHLYVGGDEQRWRATRPLAIGNLYRLIEDNMKAAIRADNSTEKLHIYSTHDTAIFSLMMVLGHPMTEWPPYGADVRYELYRDGNGQHFVQVLFSGQEYTPPGCESTMIPFSKYLDMVKYSTISPEQYKHICCDLDVAREFAKKIVDAEKNANVKN